MWRKIFLFFAAFFCLSISLTATSCKKKKNILGKDLLSSDEIMYSSGIDTFDIITYTVLEDSAVSTHPEFNMIGSYTDEFFGTVEANFYTQLTLSGFSPEFGDLNTLAIDSAVMAFEYGGYYGKLDEQTFEVYEVLEELSRDSSYTRTSIVEISSQNLVPTDNDQGTIKPTPEDPAHVGNDTLMPQLRIPIDTVFARHLLSLAETSTNDESFLEQFKGLHFRVNNPTFPVNKGGILYLASTKKNSKLTIYYTKDESQQSFDFIIQGKAVDFNHLDVEFSGTKAEDVIDNPEAGRKEYYVQALTTRAKVEFPSIDQLPKNIIIHNATLELPISYFEGDDFYISTEVTVTSKLFEDDERKYIVSTVGYNSMRRSYVIDLRSYLQNIINGEIKNNGIYISPKRYNTTVERIIFNGTNSTNKKQPKLNIVYTEL